MEKFFSLGRTCGAIMFSVPIKQHAFDTKCRKTTALIFHRCLINTGVEKINNIQI
jgi:hypothetical protein